MARGRPTRRSAKRDKIFFEAIESGLKIEDAAKGAGYSLRSVMYYKAKDLAFKKQFEESAALYDEAAFFRMKGKLLEMAENGWNEEKIVQRTKKNKDGKSEPQAAIVTRTKKQSPTLMLESLRVLEAGRFNYARKREDSDLESATESIEEIDQQLSALLGRFVK